LGMASQPARSAFSLATIAVGLYYYVAVVSSNLIDLTVNDGAIGPKFGDRISPRHRPFVELDTNSTLSRASRSDISDVTNNKFNISNSYLRATHPATDSVYYNNDDENDENAVTQSEAVIFVNTNNKLELNRNSDDVVRVPVTNVELPVIGNRLDEIDMPSTASSITRSTTVRPGGVVLAAKPTTTPANNKIVTPPTIISTNTSVRREPWVLPVLVLSSIAMIMMAAFEVFVLCKAWRTSPSRRHLFLGQMLLLGLFSCAGLAAILTATPTLLSCGAIRFGAGVAFALVFASLLVKCVFLISLNGGVYLPAPYQGLLLLFAVLIQVAIGVQWLFSAPPAVEQVPVASRSGTSLTNRYPLLLTAQDITTTVPLCNTPFPELLFSLIYVVFLILFVAVLAIKSRGIRDNYREATYIGLAIGGSIPIWLGWTLCGLAVSDRHKDACLAFGLVATSATVFLVMFMPKGRQLAAMGKEGLYMEDREEQFSSLSRAGSGYSPSFFHFKPIKYGVMGPAPTSTTNTGIGTSTKHQAVATLGGDRVALVAAPPSYTRMYHYFPAQLTHPFCYYPPAPQTARYPGTAFIRINGDKKHGGLFMRPDDANLYTTLEPTLSSNPNVYFQRGGGVHPGMMY
ncbi:Metabotropic glutamate receptor, partial [Pseudolycoriella hygida]